MTTREKKICERYSKRDSYGLVHCNECPLVVDHGSHLCKANAVYNRKTKEWEPKEYNTMKTKVLKYQVEFTRLNKKLLEEEPELYKTAVIIIRLDELQEKGAVMIKMNKATKNGTKITFRPVDGYQECYEEQQKIIKEGEALGMKFKTVTKSVDA